MASQPQRDPWRIVWRVATSDMTLVVLLLSVALGLSLAAWLPQVPANDSAYARWLSETQARFGRLTSPMRTLGLFTITRGVGFRLLLALLAGCLLMRSVERGDRLRRGSEVTDPVGAWCELPDCTLPDVAEELRERRYRVLEAEDEVLQIDRWPWGDLGELLAHGGGLLLLLGLLLMHRWGWQVSDLILQPGERMSLPGAGWVAWNDAEQRLTHSAGAIVHVERRGPGVQVAASRGDESLSLQQVAGADPVTQLTLPLIEDQYFAVPEAELIVRMTPQSEDVGAPVNVQLYRSPPGRLIDETVAGGNSDTDLAVEDVTLRLVRSPYARVTVTSNPGRWPAGLGLLLIAVGLVGGMVWSPRRFWLRQKDGGGVEGVGSLPARPASLAVSGDED